jgi:hypothetical protein
MKPSSASSRFFLCELCVQVTTNSDALSTERIGMMLCVRNFRVRNQAATASPCSTSGTADSGGSAWPARRAWKAAATAASSGA